MVLWLKNTSQFSKAFIKNYNEDKEGYFLEVDVRYTKKLHDLHNDLPFLPRKLEIEEVKKFAPNLHDKKNMSYT